jgi:hypothetical protein
VLAVWFLDMINDQLKKFKSRELTAHLLENDRVVTENELVLTELPRPPLEQTRLRASEED